MDQIIVTPASGSAWSLLTRAEVSTLKTCIQKRSLLGQDTVEMMIESATPLPFKIRDRITIFGSAYYLNALPKVTKSGSRLYEYALTWEGRQYDLLHAKYLDEGDDGISISQRFSLTGNIELFLNVLINNLDRVYGAGKWILGSYPTTKYLTLSFDEENCLAVLQKLCSQDNFNLEFEITENTPGVCLINIEDAVGTTHSQTYKYGKGRGLYSLTRQTVSNKNLITRLYAFGSDINLPSNYRGYSQSLKLPENDKSFIEDDAAIAQFGLIEGSKTFSDIYPHRTGAVTSLGSTIQRFIDSGMDFDLNAVDVEGNTLYLINGTAPKIHFNTGNLAGYDFEISSYDHSTRTFALKAFKDERGMVFPNESSAFQFQVGDEYVIFDIIMPLTYITEAENELLIEATKYLEENSQPRVQYALSFDEFHLEKTFGGGAIPNIFSVGDYITIQDTEIGVNKAIRVHAFTRDILRPYNYNLELTDIKEITLFQQVLSDVMETSKIIAFNKLNDVSRAKRNWRATQELLDMVFDPDGYFDGTRIKPESIETMMLSVGTRSQQLSLNCTIEPNYGGDPAEVNVTAGTLSHYGLGEDILNWNISASQPTLLDTGAYYIYAKCSKSDNSGNILFSQTQFKVDDDPDYYHFLLGVLHSVEDDVRWISMTYGATAINGRYIRTGRVSSQDGLNYFDLDQNQLMMGDANSSLDWNVTAANQLTLKGALVQSSGGVTFPVGCFRGAYDPTNVYYRGDEVTNAGESWLYINPTPSSGHTPIEGSYWTQKAAKGADGADGLPGTPGADGEQGPAGADGAPGADGLTANENLIENSGFEDGARKWTRSSNVTLVTDEKFAGAQCLKVVGALNESRVASYEFTGVKRGYQYTFSLFRKTQDVVAGSTNPFKSIIIEYYNGISYIGTAISGHDAPEDSDWTRLALTFATSTVLTYDRLRVYALYLRDCSGTIWVDNIKLEEGAVATPWQPAFADHTGNYTEYRYAKNGSTSTPPSIIPTDLAPAGWTTAPPATGAGEFLWLTTAVKRYDGTTLISNWTTPVRIKGEVGATGSAGPSAPYQGLYSPVATYIGNSIRCDVVKYNNHYYRARVDAPGGSFSGHLPTDTAFWNDFGANFESVATALLFAELAYVDNLGVRVLKGSPVPVGDLSGTVTTVTPNIPLDDPWDPDTYYNVNGKCSNGGVNYICLIANKGEPLILPYWSNDTAQPAKRKDKITLSGTSGSASITCDGISRQIDYSVGGLSQTASDYVALYAADWMAGGVTLTSVSEDLFLESTTAGVNFTGSTTIANTPNLYRGSIVIRGNEMWEDNEDNELYGFLAINKRGYHGGHTRNRGTLIGDGKGNTSIAISAIDVGGVYKGLNLLHGMPIRLAQMSTTEINALTAREGTLAYDITTHTLKIRTNTGWKTVSAS